MSGRQVMIGGRLLLSPSHSTPGARLTARSLHAHGGTSIAAGTAAFLARFEREADSDGSLPPAKRP
jgi:hypothetical protein